MSAKQQFANSFSQTPQAIGHAWGRVNLIGEHLDYNGGMVLPAPIERHIEVAMAFANADHDEVQSNAFAGIVKRSTVFELQAHWSDYVAASLALARKLGLLNEPVKVAIYSDIPAGAGVSSSAALIVASLRALLDLSGYHAGAKPSATIIAQWAQRVENEYIGVPCGIMDQIAVSVTEPGQAIALDTETLEHSLVALPQEYRFSVVHSGVTRKLDEGRYAERRQQCEDAAAKLNVPLLCKMTEEQSSSIEQLAEPLRGRARHVFTEHQRVLRAIDMLAQGEVHEFGKLMDLSHESMRDDFEISVLEIDRLVASCRQYGAVGARMTGGGFGGCIVACIAAADFSEWSKKLLAAHPAAKIIC